MNSPTGDSPSAVRQRFLQEYERHASRMYLVAYGILRNMIDLVLPLEGGRTPAQA